MYVNNDKRKTKGHQIELTEVFRNLLRIVRRNIYLFIICEVIALVLAYWYIKYTGPVYEVYTSLIIEDDRNSNTSNADFSMDMMSTNITSLLPGNNNVENQMYVLKSYDNSFKTIKKLNNKIEYYDKSSFFKEQLFMNTPFTVIINMSKPQLVEAYFYLEIIDNSTFKLRIEADDSYLYDYLLESRIKGIVNFEYEGVHSFGEDIVTDYFSFVLKKNYNDLAVKEYCFVIKDLDVLTKSLRSNLNIERVNRDGGVVKISLVTKYPEEGINILNVFTNVYLQYNINKKNAVVDKMIEFVEAQFDNVSNSLKVSEDKLQYFQSDKDVVNIAAQGQLVIEKLNALENERDQISSKLAYLEDLKKNIIKGDHDGILTSTARGVDYTVLNDLVNRINEISIQRTALVSGLNNAKRNPQVIVLDAQINELKKSLVENVNNIISQTKKINKDINLRISRNKRHLKELPSKQRGLVNIQRNNEINSQLYSQLLERKLNYYIMKASNILNKDVVEEARIAEAIPLMLRKELIYLFSFFWGFAVPLCIIIFIRIFDNKIKSKEDIEEITSRYFISSIPRAKDESEKKIMNNPLSAFSESYRLVRYRLSIMNKGSKCFKILVTSTVPQEGKTLTSINIATSFAMLKKKIILVECDLRKPSLAKEFKIKEKPGISSYLSGQTKIYDIINKTEHEFLDVIISGNEPANPSELIESDSFSKLVSELEKKYDYIVFDTPPIGLVSDALLLGKFADFKLLIVRSGKIQKKAFEDIVNRLEENNSNNVGIIFNADENSHENYYGYKYSSYCKQV